MRAALLLALLAAPARARDAARAVEETLARVEAILAAERGKDAAEIAAQDLRAEELFLEIKPLGTSAAAPLGAAAQNLKRPPKLRLFAVNFLARLRRPDAVAPLCAVAVDPEQDAQIRSAALQGLHILDAPAPALRRVLCAIAAQAEPPREVLDEALAAVSRLGCEETRPLERIARAHGPRPRGRDLETARRALQTLGRSPGRPPAEALLSLVAYFPPRAAARAEAIKALAEKRAEVTGALAGPALAVLVEALRSQTQEPATMLILIGLAADLGPKASRALLPLTAHPDPEVLVAAAEALAKLKEGRALAPLEKVLGNSLQDARFAPREGRPDPARLLERLEAAALSLRPDGDQRRASSATRSK